ncbi:unnamed protein product [Sphenostylis stenocarpa]|uniref:Uncharacterized protein n=1 Tax=Sphenostylis stenocarpa TaxID=92480 RepID=A0AA86S011_9FABA|nr:unnamed protein product [Sphenostylis stenocarpa]
MVPCIENGTWKGPPLLLLLFADYILIVCCAFEEQIKLVKPNLDEFSWWRPLRAKLFAIKLGLLLHPWNMDFRKASMESDCLDAISAIHERQQRRDVCPRHKDIIKDISSRSML